MARDTDRKVISEALRLANRRGAERWEADRDHDYDGRPTLSLNNFVTTEAMEITYSENGRITKLVHWQLLEPGSHLASREVIETGRRKHVLEVIG